MSMVRQLIAALANVERQINDELMKLRSYESQIDKVTQQVNNVLGDSNQQYARQMMDQLSTTKQQVGQTIQSLQSAKDKIAQVKMI